jgi:DNA-binding LacI/PurR family transcriptional regulator
VADVARNRGRSVTTQDVARAAAVSRVTVSRVLNNHHNVTDGVRQRVLRAAADLGYLSQRSRPTLISGNGTTATRQIPVLRDIGFFFTALGVEQPSGNPFWSLVLHGVEQEASAAGMHVTYRSIGGLADQPEALLEAVSSARLDGVLLVGPASDEAVQALRGAERPLVLVDQAVAGVPVDAVVSDNFGGTREAVGHLVELGHRDIAFLGGPFRVSPPPLSHRTSTVWSIEQRAQGYRVALSEAGIRPDDRLYYGDDLGTYSGYADCQRLLASSRRFTAICCANDEIAIGAMRALHEAGLSVPRDVSVVGFDDIEVAEHLIPPLTTVRVDKEAIGACAVDRLVARALAPASVTATTVLHVELVRRGTVAPPS